MKGIEYIRENVSERELLEEFADVSIIVFVLFSFMVTLPFIYENDKIKRWVKRLKEAKAARAKEVAERG